MKESTQPSSETHDCTAALAPLSSNHRDVLPSACRQEETERHPSRPAEANCIAARSSPQKSNSLAGNNAVRPHTPVGARRSCPADLYADRQSEAYGAQAKHLPHTMHISPIKKVEGKFRPQKPQRRNQTKSNLISSSMLCSGPLDSAESFHIAWELPTGSCPDLSSMLSGSTGNINRMEASPLPATRRRAITRTDSKVEFDESVKDQAESSTPTTAAQKLQREKSLDKFDGQEGRHIKQKAKRRSLERSKTALTRTTSATFSYAPRKRAILRTMSGSVLRAINPFTARPTPTTPSTAPKVLRRGTFSKPIQPMGFSTASDDDGHREMDIVTLRDTPRQCPAGGKNAVKLMLVPSVSSPELDLRHMNEAKIALFGHKRSPMDSQTCAHTSIDSGRIRRSQSLNSPNNTPLNSTILEMEDPCCLQAAHVRTDTADHTDSAVAPVASSVDTPSSLRSMQAGLKAPHISESPASASENPELREPLPKGDIDGASPHNGDQPVSCPANSETSRAHAPLDADVTASTDALVNATPVSSLAATRATTSTAVGREWAMSDSGSPPSECRSNTPATNSTTASGPIKKRRGSLFFRESRKEDGKDKGRQGSLILRKFRSGSGSVKTTEEGPDGSQEKHSRRWSKVSLGISASFGFRKSSEPANSTKSASTPSGDTRRRSTLGRLMSSSSFRRPKALSSSNANASDDSHGFRRRSLRNRSMTSNPKLSSVSEVGVANGVTNTRGKPLRQVSSESALPPTARIATTQSQVCVTIAAGTPESGQVFSPVLASKKIGHLNLEMQASNSSDASVVTYDTCSIEEKNSGRWDKAHLCVSNEGIDVQAPNGSRCSGSESDQELPPLPTDTTPAVPTQQTTRAAGQRRMLGRSRSLRPSKIEHGGSIPTPNSGAEGCDKADPNVPTASPAMATNAEPRKDAATQPRRRLARSTSLRVSKRPNKSEQQLQQPKGAKVHQPLTRAPSMDQHLQSGSLKARPTRITRQQCKDLMSGTYSDRSENNKLPQVVGTVASGTGLSTNIATCPLDAEQSSLKSAAPAGIEISL